MATAEPPTLLDRIADHLDHRAVPFALIGAAALAVHGISRSTLDIDLLVTDPLVLESAFWEPLPPTVTRDIRPGDPTDPLAGVVRFRTAGDRQDRWDIEQLLNGPDRPALVEEVARLVPRLPPDAQALWRVLSTA